MTKQFLQSSQNYTVLTDISVEFKQGKTYAITGASGSGKSTFMHLLAGLDTPTSGSVFFNTTSLYDLPSHERARSVVLVTQSPFLIQELTVFENITLAGLMVGMSRKEVEDNATYFLHKVGLSATASWNIGALSGGQRQRVALARALVVHPAFLCADEVTGSLDEHTGNLVVELLLQCQKDLQMGLIVSSHSQTLVRQMELVFALKDGILSPDYTPSILKGNYERSAA